MVNKELFLKIADMIESCPDQYAQHVSCEIGSCGTVACIGGWAMVLSGIPEKRVTVYSLFRGDGKKLITSAQEFLGLSDNDADKLFGGDWKPKSEYTVPEALRAIANGKSVSEVSA